MVGRDGKGMHYGLFLLFISLILARIVNSIQKQWIRVVISFVFLILGVILNIARYHFYGQ